MRKPGGGQGINGASGQHAGDQGAVWAEAGLEARPVELRVGFRRRKVVPGVELSAGGWTAQMRLDELRDLARGKVGIVDSAGEGSLVFLARVAAAAPDSVAGMQMAGLPTDAVALLPARDGTPPAAVLDRAVFEDFARWLGTLSG